LIITGSGEASASRAPPEHFTYSSEPSFATAFLLGLFWFLQFTVSSEIQHDAVYNQILETAASPTDQLYFSFVTLTTLGYGDIIPSSQLAKVITIFTSLSGVLYISVFVAALVSKNTAK
jgi:voltage-gated potassium channel Kch